MKAAHGCGRNCLCSLPLHPHQILPAQQQQLGLVYDALFKAICVIPAVADERAPRLLLETGTTTEQQKQETRIGLKTFKLFLSEICSWARDDKIISNGFQVTKCLEMYYPFLSNFVLHF